MHKAMARSISPPSPAATPRPKAQASGLTNHLTQADAVGAEGCESEGRLASREESLMKRVGRGCAGL